MKKILPKLILIGSLFAPMTASAQLSSADTGLTTTVKKGYGVSESIISLPEFVGSYIVAPILGLTGTIIFVLMTYAGFLWVTAQGDEKKVKKAKDILNECIVGAVILVGAYALANFVVTSLSATTVVAATAAAASN
jgi:cytochrome bd-type quinol oxidase subunit 2